MTLRALRCNNAGVTDRWLQCHSGVAIPADTAVPVRTPLYLPANYISEDTLLDGGVIAAPGLVLVVSSTRATLTKDVAATVDITADVDEYEQAPTEATAVGDTTTGVISRQIWASSAGPKRLVRVDYSNTTGASIYAQVFARDSLIASMPSLSETLVAANSSVSVSFGGGLVPYEQTSAFVVHKGCTICFSTTAGVLTAVGGASGTIRAYYQ